MDEGIRVGTAEGLDPVEHDPDLEPTRPKTRSTTDVRKKSARSWMRGAGREACERVEEEEKEEEEKKEEDSDIVLLLLLKGTVLLLGAIEEETDGLTAVEEERKGTERAV